MLQNKITLVLLFFSMIFSPIIAQEAPADVLTFEIPETKSDLITKARNALMDAFMQNNKKQVWELQQYLSANFDASNYVALFPSEKILVLAWLRDYDGLLYFVQKLNSTYYATLYTKIMPTSTNNFPKIVQTTVLKEYDSIFNDLQASALTQEEKDFLAIHLYYYLVTEENYDEIVRRINTDTQKFFEKYPDSEYKKQFKNYELRPSNWGFGLGVDFGYSPFTGNLKSSFESKGTMNLSFDVSYKQFNALVGVDMLFSSVRKDITNSDGAILEKGISSDLMNLVLSFGYKVFHDKRIILTPTAGIGYAFINQGTENERKENPSLKKFDYSYGLVPHVGLIADIRLGKIRNTMGQNFVEPSYYAVRLGYKFFYNNLGNVPTLYNGNVHSITVGIYMFGRSKVQVKY